MLGQVGTPVDAPINSLTAMRDMASNIGIAFKTPEEYFLKEEPKAFLRNFDPNQYVAPSDANDAPQGKTLASPIAPRLLSAERD